MSAQTQSAPTGISIGLGVLSWHGHASLRQAFESYAKEDLFSLFDDSLLFLPDPTDDVRAVGADYPIRVEEHPDNLGILGGMEEIAKRLTTDYILFTENDCPLVEPLSEAKRQIAAALSILHEDRAIMARMRHTRDYGETFDTIDKYRRYHIEDFSPIAELRKALRPFKARRLSGTAIYAGDGHPERFPRDIEPVENGFYLVDTKALPWTNQSILIRRAVFLDRILPFCKSVPFDRGINGFRSVEIELNGSKFWRNSGWKVACGKGLFTHKRAADRGY